MIAALAAIALAALAGAPPASLDGAWTLLGQPFASFHKNGSCVIEDEPCTWRVKGATLFVTGAGLDAGETEAMPFALAGNVLTITVNGIPVALERPGVVVTAPAASVPAQASAPASPSAGKMDPSDPLAQLLLSSPWCHFWFNKVSGASGNERVQYFADGSYQLGKRSESYSSGSGGTVSGESRSGGSGLWYVQKGQLFGTPPPSEAMPNPDRSVFYPLPLVVNKNSNGFPIIVAAGKEYSQCP